MRAYELFEANPNQQVSRWHPETRSYRGVNNPLPQSTSVDPDDITARYQQVDQYTSQEVGRNINTLLGQGNTDPINDVETKITQQKLIPLVKAAMKDLAPDEKEVLNYRFWHNLTLEQTAEKLGISAARVRQIEAKALRKLNHASRGDPLRKAVGLPTRTPTAPVNDANYQIGFSNAIDGKKFDASKFPRNSPESEKYRQGYVDGYNKARNLK